MDKNSADRVFVLPTLPSDVDEANRLYGSMFSNCVRNTDLDNMTKRWLMATTSHLKRGKKNRKLMTGDLICDIYLFKSGDKYLNQYELASLFQTLVGTVVADISDIKSYRIRIGRYDEENDTPYVIGHIREVDYDDNVEALFPEFTDDFVRLILDRLTPVE